MQKVFTAVTVSLVSFILIFDVPLVAHASTPLGEPTVLQPQTTPYTESTSDPVVSKDSDSGETSTDFLMQSMTLSAAESDPCTTEMCGVSAGQTVSGTIYVQPNLDLNPDVRKVAYYLNGTFSTREYTSPFTWGGSAGFDTTKLQNGNYTVSGAFTTKSGDKSFSIAFTVNNTGAPDTTPPVISAVTSTNITSSGASINWTTDEASDSQVEYRVQGTTDWLATNVNASLVRAHSVALTGLNADTTYEYRVKSKDQAGNLATQAAISNFKTTDGTTPPSGDFVGVTEGATVNGVVNIGPNLTTHPSVRKVAYYLNGSQSGKVYASPFFWGGPAGNGTAGFDTKTLADGNYSLSMGYTDSTGDHNAAISFIVNNSVPDTTAPVISAVSAANITSTGATISWTTDEASDSQVEYRVQGTTSWSATSVNAALVTNHSVALTGLNASTAYEYRVKSKDQAGNLATQATISTLTTTTPDTTAPVISAVSATNITSSGATINWTTDEVSDSQVEYRVQGTTTWSATSVNAAFVTNHSVALTGLNASTAYEYRVKSKDPSGNLATQATISTLTTAAASGTGDFSGVTPGATIKGVVNIGPNLTVHSGIQKVAYYLNGSKSGKVYTSPFYWGGIKGDGTAGFDTKTIIDGSHTLSMAYTDSTGEHNVSITFKVNNTVDGTEFPVITEVEAWGVTSNQATIIWKTNEASDSQVEYRVQGTSAWSATGVNSSLAVNHWVTVTGLSASTQYEFRVKSKDPEGNFTTHATISNFTTGQPSADTVPPKILIVSWTDITSTQASINWRTDENSDSRLRYRAQGTATWIMTSLRPAMKINHSILLTGLTAATPYEVQVFSQDASGNLVAQETVSRFTTADLVSASKITGIKDGDTVTGVVTIGPDLAAFGTIEKVDYYVDGINRGSSWSSPFTWGGSGGFPSRELTNTPHKFKVVIMDSTGPHEINLNFTAYNTDIPPSTEFTGITNGQTVSGTVNIGVDLSKHPDIKKVQYYLDFAQSGKVYTSPFLWGGFNGDGTTGFDTRTISNNPHMLIMFYTDSTGDHEGRIDFIVNN